MTGTGANQALGVFTASNDGIPTSRDVSTGNTTTSIQTDGLIEAKYSLRPGYMAKASWIFHRDAVKQIRKLKDGDGQYIWQQGLTGGQPDRILDSPFKMSEYAPNTFTTGLYVGIIGDFKYFWVVDALSFEIQRLVELYARTNQDGFIGRFETDGMPVLGEAFARVKLA
jgi:HK97 family phage major capsid protein